MNETEKTIEAIELVALDREVYISTDNGMEMDARLFCTTDDLKTLAARFRELEVECESLLKSLEWYQERDALREENARLKAQFENLVVTDDRNSDEFAERIK